MSDKRKIITIPGQKTSAPAFCGMLMENADEIENIATVVKYKNGEVNVFSTYMPLKEATLLHWVFNQEFPKIVDPDGEYWD